MSVHTVNRSPRKSLTVAAAGSAGVWLALMVSAGPASSIELPEPVHTSAAVAEPGPPNYPNYDPQYDVSPPVQLESGIDATSVAVGALVGVALSGAAFTPWGRRGTRWLRTRG